MEPEFSEEVIGVPKTEFFEELGSPVTLTEPKILEGPTQQILRALREVGMNEQADIVEEIVERRLLIEELLKQLRPLSKSTGGKFRNIESQIIALEEPKSVRTIGPDTTTTIPSVQLYLSQDNIFNIVLTTIIERSENLTQKLVPIKEVHQLALNRRYFGAAQEVTKKDGIRPIIRNKTVGLRIPPTEIKNGFRSKAQIWARANDEDKVPTKIIPAGPVNGDKYWLTVQADNPPFEEGETTTPIRRSTRKQEREPLLALPETTTIEGTLLTLLREFRDKFIEATPELEEVSTEASETSTT